MKLRIWFTKSIIKYPYLYWMLGLMLPALYFTLLLSINKILKNVTKKDNVLVFFVVVLFLQLISLSLTVFYPFFSIGRFGAILHNIFAFSFVFLGYIILFDTAIKEFLIKNISKLFYAVALLVFLGAMYTIVTKEGSQIKTIPNLLGISSKFFNATFSYPAWHFVPDFPRTRVLSIYPNGTGITLLLIHAIYMNFNYYTAKKIQIITFIIFILCVFTTGSRAFLVLSVFLFIVYFINSKSKLWLLTFLVPILLIAFIIVSNYLLSGRRGSNEMRMLIYSNSFQYMLDINPFFGLGMKPIIPELADKYPLGSHSTPWGYIIKCGLIGGGIILLTYVSIIVKYLIYLFELTFTDKKLNPQRLYLFSSFVAVLIALIFEDLDAYELMPFYFGILVWQFYRMKITNNELDTN